MRKEKHLGSSFSGRSSRNAPSTHPIAGLAKVSFVKLHLTPGISSQARPEAQPVSKMNEGRPLGQRSFDFRPSFAKRRCNFGF
jgi:hypothetical protein